ncbi:hypothetical protein HDU77_006146 [Chytriomyces hyalinus]|nr:hypothetical protein HDU77_006146 [Chytriomyces hyalinus]
MEWINALINIAGPIFVKGVDKSRAGESPSMPQTSESADGIGADASASLPDSFEANRPIYASKSPSSVDETPHKSSSAGTPPASSQLILYTIIAIVSALALFTFVWFCLKIKCKMAPTAATPPIPPPQVPPSSKIRDSTATQDFPKIRNRESMSANEIVDLYCENTLERRPSAVNASHCINVNSGAVGNGYDSPARVLPRAIHHAPKFSHPYTHRQEART